MINTVLSYNIQLTTQHNMCGISGKISYRIESETSRVITFIFTLINFISWAYHGYPSLLKED